MTRDPSTKYDLTLEGISLNWEWDVVAWWVGKLLQVETKKWSIWIMYLWLSYHVFIGQDTKIQSKYHYTIID